MPQDFVQGTAGYTDLAAAIPKSYQGVSNEWFINRTPLFSRLPKAPVGAPRFQMIGHKFRTRTSQLNGAIADGTTATFVFQDASNLMVGDVLQTPAGEAVEVTAAPTSSTTVTVRRGVGGTTAAAIADTTVLNVIGNSRTGAEKNQLALTSKPTTADQYVQTFQHVASVGGLVQSSASYVLAPGRATPFDQYRMDALQNLMDDVETSSLYGIGEDPAVAVTGRGKQFGIRSILATNKVTNPVAKNAYKPSDFMSDAVQSCFANGGNPDLIVCSTDWMTGLARWSLPVQRLDAGESRFGERITAFLCPFLGDLTIIPCPMLRPKTAVVLSSAEVRFRLLRPIAWSAYGRTGDAREGDWITSAAIEVENEQHHAWVEGVVSFTPEA
jgi:uncharacterized protein DUF5309